jgi:uncharacterized membrane protein
MRYFLTFVVVFSLISCVKNKEEMPAPEAAVDTSGPVITYTQHTKKIFDNYCITCHAAGLSQSNFPLTTYNEVTFSTYAEIGGKIEKRVLIQGNMPPSGSAAGQLTAAEKDTLQMWINKGAIE